MKPEEIRELTNDAEAGLGCKVAEKLLAVPLEEQKKILEQMRALNKGYLANHPGNAFLGIVSHDFTKEQSITRASNSYLAESNTILTVVNSSKSEVLPSLPIDLSSQSEFMMKSTNKLGSFEMSCRNLSDK